MEAEFVAHCPGVESHQAHQEIAGSHLRGHSSARTDRRWYVRQVAGIRRHHRWTDLSVAAALVGHLVGLLIVERVLPMVLSAVVAAVAVAELAAEWVEALVTVVELADEWAVVVVQVPGEVYCCSSLIDLHCSLVVGHRRAMGSHCCTN